MLFVAHWIWYPVVYFDAFQETLIVFLLTFAVKFDGVVGVLGVFVLIETTEDHFGA